MAINKLIIQNFKSIVNIEVEFPNNFMAFFGPNSSGKSNIFESMEIASLLNSDRKNAFDYIPNFNDIINKNNPQQLFNFTIGQHPVNNNFANELNIFVEDMEERKFECKNNLLPNDKELFSNFSRIFIGNSKIAKKILKGDKKLSLDCKNLESVLKRILKDSNIANEIMEIMTLLVPGFESMEIEKDNITGEDTLLLFEKSSSKPFKKNLISDGTYNIICILTVLFQDNDPQFICIEEPENGLNPKVISELINIFRDKCNENGDFIWLNTHSQSLVSNLRPNEAIVVDKLDGITQIKELKNIDTFELRLDEAWLSNFLGRGLPW